MTGLDPFVLSEHQLRGWRAVSAEGLQGRGLRKRNILFTDTGIGKTSAEKLPFTVIIIIIITIIFIIAIIIMCIFFLNDSSSSLNMTVNINMDP